jgi:hypothetical protein
MAVTVMAIAFLLGLLLNVIDFILLIELLRVQSPAIFYLLIFCSIFLCQKENYCF